MATTSDSRGRARTILDSPAGEMQPLLDIPEVARLLGVGERHVRRLVFERRIPFVKWGRLVRFNPSDLRDWIASARIESR